MRGGGLKKPTPERQKNEGRGGSVPRPGLMKIKPTKVRLMSIEAPTEPTRGERPEGATRGAERGDRKGRHRKGASEVRAKSAGGGWQGKRSMSEARRSGQNPPPSKKPEATERNRTGARGRMRRATNHERSERKRSLKGDWKRATNWGREALAEYLITGNVLHIRLISYRNPTGLQYKTINQYQYVFK